jgi:hypothetical protein
MCGHHPDGMLPRAGQLQKTRTRDAARDRHAYNSRPEVLRRRAEQAQARRAADPERARDADRRSRERNGDVRRARQRAAGPAKRLKSKYGLTPERVAQMAAEQDGLCYLCGEPLDLSTPRKAHVDHDHSCCRGQNSCGTCIRGIACQLCNQGIGAFGDDPERMRRVADSLEMANRRLREAPALFMQDDLFSTTRGSDTAERPGE